MESDGSVRCEQSGNSESNDLEGNELVHILPFRLGCQTSLTHVETEEKCCDDKTHHFDVVFCIVCFFEIKVCCSVFYSYNSLFNSFRKLWLNSS